MTLSARLVLALVAVFASVAVAGCGRSSSWSARGDTPAEPSPSPSSGGDVDAAKQAALSWLALVDGARYAESWDGAAAYFRGAVTKQAWTAQVGGVRGPLGALRSRQLTSATPATSLPGAPDGAYVVIQYQTVFEHEASAVETVTPMRDPDGQWRVSGYFIR